MWRGGGRREQKKTEDSQDTREGRWAGSRKRVLQEKSVEDGWKVTLKSQHRCVPSETSQVTSLRGKNSEGLGKEDYRGKLSNLSINRHLNELIIDTESDLTFEVFPMQTEVIT